MYKIFVFTKISDFSRKATSLLFHRILWSCVQTRPINLQMWYNVHLVMMHNISNFQRSSINHEWERIVSSLSTKTFGSRCIVVQKFNRLILFVQTLIVTIACLQYTSNIKRLVVRQLQIWIHISHSWLIYQFILFKVNYQKHNYWLSKVWF